MSYLEFTEITTCPTCGGRPADKEGCIVCDGWGKVPVIHEIASLVDFHELVLRIHSENLRVTADGG